MLVAKSCVFGGLAKPAKWNLAVLFVLLKSSTWAWIHSAPPVGEERLEPSCISKHET